MTNHDTLVESWMPEFRAAHEGDDLNAVRQSFEDYWNWVRVFLVTGGAGQRGWLEQGDEVLARVEAAAVAEQLRGRVHAIGKRIAAEWAKDGRSRRIYSTRFQGSPNLRDWGKQLQLAAGEEAGDGATIERALDAIEHELETALAI